MANLNKVILIGRLTRDPEAKTFANGGKVVKFGFAVTNRRKDAKTNEWVDDPMFIDCEAFNRGDSGTLATQIEDRCRKGTQIVIEGKLKLSQWEDKTGGKRSKHEITVDSVQFLEKREAAGVGASSDLGDEQPEGEGVPF